jgi:hypothetical protein
MMKPYESWINAADTPPPRDGSPFWAYLFDSGIRRMFWESAADYAERTGQKGAGDGYAEWDDPDEEWTPLFWLPDDALPTPPTK